MEKYAWHRAISLKQGVQPSSRWGHASVMADSHLIIFGGYADSHYMNDLWAFNVETMIWEQVKTSGTVPTTRSNCTLHFDTGRQQLVLFGGGGPNKFRYNDVNVLDWTSKQWHSLSPPQGQRTPLQRTYHTSELLYPYLLIFGGEGIADLDDLWAFNLQTQHWTELPISKLKQRPCARRFHSSALIGTTLYIIAGCHDKYRCLSDIFSIELAPFLSSNTCSPLQWKEIQVKGSSFLTRWGQTSSVYQGRIYIFAGRFSNDLNDILVLDPQKQTLKCIKAHGESPKPRRRHSSAFIGSNLIIFGGFNGQYFNDLHYINVFDQTHKKDALFEIRQQNAWGRWINRQFLSDFQVATRNGETFYGHRGLIIDQIQSQQQFSQFLQVIDGQFSQQQLYNLFYTLSSGIGSINHLPSCLEHSFPIFETKEQKYTHFRRFLTGQQQQMTSLLPQNRAESSVITLTASQYSNLFTTLANCDDFAITFNQQFTIAANRAQLAIRSKYFQYLFKHNPYLDSLQINLPQMQVDIRVIQSLQLFVRTGYFIVTEGLDEYSWMSMLQLGEYFCLAVRQMCEGELVLRLSRENSNALLEFALKERLQILKQHCVQIQLRKSLQKGQGKSLMASNKSQMNQWQSALYNLHQMWRFDLIQSDLRKKQAQMTTKGTACKSAEKENVQMILN